MQNGTLPETKLRSLHSNVTPTWCQHTATGCIIQKVI
uniref:Uncharacterized protein n=1 Tax=Anguilla anguilla TaxID=7936 RepID=A0A0E9PY00_ANGAN